MTDTRFVPQVQLTLGSQYSGHTTLYLKYNSVDDRANDRHTLCTTSTTDPRSTVFGTNYTVPVVQLGLRPNGRTYKQRTDRRTDSRTHRHTRCTTSTYVQPTMESQYSNHTTLYLRTYVKYNSACTRTDGRTNNGQADRWTDEQKADDGQTVGRMT